MLSARTISLFVLTSLSAGAETRVRISGMQSQSEGQVISLLGDRLEHVRTDAASASRADDAAFLLRETLQKDGYARARVDWKIIKRDEILLTVNEGPRLSLGTVTVNGVPADDQERLAGIYSNPAKKSRPFGSGPAPFRREDVPTGLSYVKQELNAQGYWAAEVTRSDRSVDPDSGAVDVVIDVKQGVLHRIGEPRVISTDGRGQREIFASARSFAGRRATTANVNALRAAVEETFVKQGYPDAQIRMGRTIQEGRFIPEFTIELGKRVRLREIHLAGLERTSPARIAQRMDDMEGDWYDEAAMNKRLRGFLSTGAFASARVEKTEVGEDQIDATLHFEERKAKEVTLAGGFGSYQGIITRTSYTDRNFLGQLLGFTAGVELGSRGVLGETKITNPWLYGTDTAVSARLFALSYTREGYSTLEAGAEATATWKFGDHYSVEATGGYSLVNITGEGLPFSSLGETVYTHPRFTITQKLDYRDSPILPKKGWHVEAPVEVGASIGDSNITYFKTGVTSGWYHALSRKSQLAIGGEFSVIVPSGDSEELPIDLRLFNGGARSVRSFPERELGPEIEGYPVGGEAMWVTNVEYIRTLAGSLKGVAFLDAGSLSRNFDQAVSSDVEVALGLGVRLDLPIGPVRLEYGYNLTRDEGEPMGSLHFAIGMAF